MTIGEKIRARRKMLGMTQKDVAGEYITRNMICRIESGEVSPSLQTLTQIANALSVSVSYLVSDKDDYALFLALETLPRLREAYASERYADCISLIRRLPDEARENEIAYLAAAAFAALAERAVVEGNLRRIPALCEEAATYAKRTVVDTSHLLARAELCRAIATNPQTPKWEVDRERYCELANRAVNLESYRYITESDTFPTYDQCVLDHIEARRLIAAHRYADALAKLTGIEERRSAERISSYLLFRIYADMEICYRELRDYENAYRYSTKRLSLLSAFQT